MKMEEKELNKPDPFLKKKHNMLMKEYGLTLFEYLAMMLKQNGECAVCGAQVAGKGKVHDPEWLRVDHCHDSGVVRGLLCVACNVGIGMLGDSPQRIDCAAAYLRQHKC
jgi:hypothetical protein